MTDSKHPMQPIVVDDHGVYRFKANALVRWLVERVPGSLNTIAMMGFTNEDREQLAMLLGYSVSGAGDLSYFSEERTQQADAVVEAMSNAGASDCEGHPQ